MTVLLDRIGFNEWEARLDDMHGRGSTRGRALEELARAVCRSERTEERMDVRCCCTPTKLYGTLPVPPDARIGDGVSFAIGGGTELILTMAPWHQKILRSPADGYLRYEAPEQAPAVTHISGVALKMEEAGRTFEENLALLRKVQGFIEHTPELRYPEAKQTCDHGLAYRSCALCIDQVTENATP